MGFELVISRKLKTPRLRRGVFVGAIFVLLEIFS